MDFAYSKFHTGVQVVLAPFLYFVPKLYGIDAPVEMVFQGVYFL